MRSDPALEFVLEQTCSKFYIYINKPFLFNLSVSTWNMSTDIRYLCSPHSSGALDFALFVCSFLFFLLLSLSLLFLKHLSANTRGDGVIVQLLT